VNKQQLLFHSCFPDWLAFFPSAERFWPHAM
jgi:hypothetical protein